MTPASRGFRRAPSARPIDAPIDSPTRSTRLRSRASRNFSTTSVKYCAVYSTCGAEDRPWPGRSGATISRSWSSARISGMKYSSCVRRVCRSTTVGPRPVRRRRSSPPRIVMHSVFRWLMARKIVRLLPRPLLYRVLRICSCGFVQQITDARVDLLAFRRCHTEHREVGPQALDDAEPAVRNEPLLGLAVIGWEEHVVGERHDQGLRLDPPERGRKVAVRVAADVTMSPLPALPDQIVRIHRQEIRLPEAVQEVLQRREANVAPGFVAIELLAQAHHRPDLSVMQNARADGASIAIEAVVPGGIGFERVFVCAHEYVVVRRRLRGSGEGKRPLHHFWKAHRPFVRLFRAHRPAEDEPETLDAIVFGHQPVLRADVVANRDVRKRAAVERRRRVARGGREAVTELSRQDDEVLPRIQRPAFTNEDLHCLRRARPHVR